MGCDKKKETERITISPSTAELCQKLVHLELERCKGLSISPRTLKTRLETAQNELAGNYIDIENLRELLKRINGNG